MALIKQITYDHSITELGHIQVRRITRSMEKVGELWVEVGKQYHRHVVSPGDDFVNEDERTKKIAKVVHTAKVIKDYKDKIKEQELDAK